MACLDRKVPFEGSKLQSLATIQKLAAYTATGTAKLYAKTFHARTLPGILSVGIPFPVRVSICGAFLPQASRNVTYGVVGFFSACRSSNGVR